MRRQGHDTRALYRVVHGMWHPALQLVRTDDSAVGHRNHRLHPLLGRAHAVGQGYQGSQEAQGQVIVNDAIIKPSLLILYAISFDSTKCIAPPTFSLLIK